MLYLVIITVAMLLIETATISWSLTMHTMSIYYAVFAPLFVNAYVVVVMGFLALVLRFIVPKKALKYNNKWFYVRKKEMNFYRKIRVKSWKDKVPEMGWTAGFPKDKIDSYDPKYLYKFLEETCFAELMHGLSAVLGFTVLFIMPVKDYSFTLPIVLVNFVLQVLPCIIQRYNRFRLSKLYERNVKLQGA